MPFQAVLKPSTYQSGNTRGGLNLNKWIPKFLKRIGFAVTTDCCLYFPSFPVLGIDFDTMDQVPDGGLFMDMGTTDAVFYKGLDGNIYVFNSSPL